jgi:hypothetical protein
LSHTPDFWHTTGARPPAGDEWENHVKERRPAATAGLAGMYLLAALILFVGLGLGAGWLLGSPAAGAIVGVVLGVPVSFYLVYRKYRDL